MRAQNKTILTMGIPEAVRLAIASVADKPLHIFGHANGVKQLNGLIGEPDEFKVHYHYSKEEITSLNSLSRSEANCWLVCVKQPSISPVLFGVDGDFPEIEEPSQLSNLHIIFLAANNNAASFFARDWKSKLLTAQPVLQAFNDRIHYLEAQTSRLVSAGLQSASIMKQDFYSFFMEGDLKQNLLDLGRKVLSYVLDWRIAVFLLCKGLFGAITAQKIEEIEARFIDSQFWEVFGW